MTRIRKYIVPLALTKIVLVFLVLQLFFSSCEESNILYNNELYAEGPLFEIPADFGNGDSVFVMGDTVYLDILVEGSTLKDQISGETFSVEQASYDARFVFCTSNGEKYFPVSMLDEGYSLQKTSESYVGLFGNYSNKSGIISNTLGPSLQRFRAGFVFNDPGIYTLYFVNTPNAFTSEGQTDIVLNDDGGTVNKAYAVYLFDDGNKTLDYAIDGSDNKVNILEQASFDQAIKEFIIVDLVE